MQDGLKVDGWGASMTYSTDHHLSINEIVDGPPWLNLLNNTEAPETKWMSLRLRHDRTTYGGEQKYEPLLGFLERSHCKLDGLTVDDAFLDIGEIFRCLTHPIIQEIETVVFSSPRICNETISFMMGQRERVDVPRIYGWFDNPPGPHSRDNRGCVGWSPRFQTNLDLVVLFYERSCGFVNCRPSTSQNRWQGKYLEASTPLVPPYSHLDVEGLFHNNFFTEQG